MFIKYSFVSYFKFFNGKLTNSSFTNYPSNKIFSFFIPVPIIVKMIYVSCCLNCQINHFLCELLPTEAGLRSNNTQAQRNYCQREFRLFVNVVPRSVIYKCLINEKLFECSPASAGRNEFFSLSLFWFLFVTTKRNNIKYNEHNINDLLSLD